MIPLDLSLFGTDPWWLVLLKVVVLFVVLLSLGPPQLPGQG